MKIFNQKFGTINESDRLTIAQLLVKAGYTVRIGKVKEANKNTYTHYVEFSTEQEGKE